ncbi:MAG TPA: VWA domain-containing protein [Acidimicrobiia bacterium]
MPDTASTIEADRMVVAFARLLRARGLEVPVGASLVFGDALARVGMDRRDSVYWTARATLVHAPEDIETFDEAFDAFWLGRASGADESAALVSLTLAHDAPDGPESAHDESDDEDDAAGPQLTVRWSRAEILRHRDFAAYTADEFAEARRMMADLRLAGALRRSRRQVRSARLRGRPDVRRTVRRALRAGGEPVSRAFREPARRPRRLVLLCDVSGSMEPYARALVRFLHAAVVGGVKVEAFALGTRLTRITRELSSRDPDAAIAAAARRVLDWSGGTRLGDGLRSFNDQWGMPGMARGAVVVILSDGWDRGDPAVLGEQMARLHRIAHRVVWVNPLKATPGYAPLAQGMAAALPYVDEFVEGHSLASLETLAKVVTR